MWCDIAVLSVTAAAGLTAGGEPIAFLAAALAAAAATWYRHGQLATQKLYANLDPLEPNGLILLDAFRKACELVRRTQRGVQLRITAFAHLQTGAFRIELSRDGDVELACGHRKQTLKQPGIWIPDHPLPLYLPRASSLTFACEPCGPTRIRVSLETGRVFRTRHAVSWLLLATAACALDTGWLLAATLGFAFQSYLLDQQAQRAPSDVRV